MTDAERARHVRHRVRQMLNSGGEWQDFVNALTTNLTSFFRESHHFSVLAEHLRKSRGQQRVNIWCCAASTGWRSRARCRRWC